MKKVFFSFLRGGCYIHGIYIIVPSIEYPEFAVLCIIVFRLRILFSMFSCTLPVSERINVKLEEAHCLDFIHNHPLASPSQYMVENLNRT